MNAQRAEVIILVTWHVIACLGGVFNPVLVAVRAVQLPSQSVCGTATGTFLLHH
jgi:hypothetical protein